MLTLAVLYRPTSATHPPILPPSALTWEDTSLLVFCQVLGFRMSLKGGKCNIAKHQNTGLSCPNQQKQCKVSNLASKLLRHHQTGFMLSGRGKGCTAISDRPIIGPRYICCPISIGRSIVSVKCCADRKKSVTMTKARAGVLIYFVQWGALSSARDFGSAHISVKSLPHSTPWNLPTTWPVSRSTSGFSPFSTSHDKVVHEISNCKHENIMEQQW